MVGAYNTDADPNPHSLLIKSGRCIPLGTGTVLQSKQSLALSLNERGDVVGVYSDGNPLFDVFTHGYLLDKKGEVTTIDYPTADGQWANAIDQSGMVVGEWWIVDAYGNTLFDRGFTWKDGSFSEVLVPGSDVTAVKGINARGEYVGWCGPNPAGSVQHAFMYSHEMFSELKVPFNGVRGTLAESISDKGEIVGAYYGDDSSFRGFLRTGSQYTPIDFPSAVMTNLNGINNAGQMVGWYYDENWVLRALFVERQK